MMTRRQIDASRERRLWLTQVGIPTAMLFVTVYQIPEAREAINRKAYEAKCKVTDFIDKIKRH